MDFGRYLAFLIVLLSEIKGRYGFINFWGRPSPAGLYSHRNDTIDDVYLRLFTGSTMTEYIDVNLPRSLELMKHEKFKKASPRTMFYIHGFEETAEQESVKVVVEAYLKAEPDTNVILVDWSNMAFGNYAFNAAPNTKKIAAALAAEIQKLIENGLSLDSIHLVGHSLGGQMIGFVGKELQKSNIKLKRLTSLDPAFPLFYYPSILDHISAEDAECVDIIHTDAGFYGAPSMTGTIDFWPNGGGGKQPGCPKFAPIPLSDDSLCSHWRSWRFWAESLLRPEAFPAVNASSYKVFKQQNTTPDPNRKVVYIGYKMDTKATGNYYLRTNCASPFGKGMDGTYITRK